MSEPDTIRDCNTRREERFVRDDNEFSLIGIDHLVMPSLDFELMARFMREVLGAQPYYLVGFDERGDGSAQAGIHENRERP